MPVVPTPTLSTSGAAVVKLTEPPTGAEPFDEPEADQKPAADKAVADAARKLKKKKAEDKKEPAEPEGKSRWTTQQLALAGGAAALLLGGGAWAFWPRGQAAGAEAIAVTGAGGADESAALGPLNGAAPDLATANIVAPVPGAPLDLSRIDSLASAVDSLARDARSAGRSGDSGRLAAASARIRALAVEVKAAAAQPGQEAVVQAKVGQMNALAKGAAASLAQGVRRDAEVKAKDIPAGASGADATAFRSALAAIRRAAAGSGSPGEAIDAARRSLSAARQVNALYPKVHASILPAKRQEFATVASAAKSVGQQVLDMGRSAKPGLFASGKRRADYRTRQANATAAQAELAKLNELSGAVAAVTTPAAAESAIKQAKAIQAKLQELRASSSAAMPGAGDDSGGNKT